MQIPAIVKKSKRRGRGLGSGKGAKSGRGMKGQRSRAGNKRRIGFEGGQTPLYQRLPKGRGVKQISKPQTKRPLALRAGDLARWSVDAIVGPGALQTDKGQSIKLIAGGKLEAKLTVRVHAATEQAIKQVEAAGGKVELIKTKRVN